MGIFLDLTGKRFGRWTAIKRAENQNGRVAWHCLCDCGNRKDVPAGVLVNGGSKSCGCLRNEIRRSIKDDLTGKRFGRLLVQNLGQRKKGRIYWHCLCDCGNTVDVAASSLKSGFTQSCGCYATEVQRRVGASSKGRHSKRLIDLTGEKFGRLTVLSRAENSSTGQTRWQCLCDCGKEVIVLAAHLRSGHSKSCGCLGLEHATQAKIKHGEANTPLYRLFRSMHNRCELATSVGYKWYGEKGIRVCPEWDDYEVFAKWARSHGYEKGLTIDRKDPSKDYEPSNCEWVTRSENSRRMHEARKHIVK